MSFYKMILYLAIIAIILKNAMFVRTQGVCMVSDCRECIFSNDNVHVAWYTYPFHVWCQQCEDGLALLSRTECMPCMQYCNRCDEYAACLQCDVNYSWDGEACVHSDDFCTDVSNCTQCSSVDVCTTCHPEFHLDQGTCAHLCNSLDNCIDCPLPTECASCSRGFEPADNGLCEDIDECDIEGRCVHGTCTNTEGSYTCGCDEGYTGESCDIQLNACMHERQAAEPLSEEDPLCTTCSSGVCTQCQDGYFPLEKHTCIDCAAAIPDCITCSGGVCATCADGMVASDNGLACMECSVAIPGCEVCTANRCVTCSDDTVPTADGSECQACSTTIPGCAVCSGGACVTCSDETVMNADGSVCQACGDGIPWCMECSAGVCITCGQDTVLIHDGAVCKPACQVDGCNSCEFSDHHPAVQVVEGNIPADVWCEQCEVGRFLHTTIHCLPCMQGCRRCDVYSDCLECEDNYSWDSSRCVPNAEYCPDMINCVTCSSPDACTACSALHRIEGGSCVYDDSCWPVENCEECAQAGVCSRCMNGFMLTDASTCIDVDECRESSNCVHGRCTNTIGGYDCWCNSGYMRDQCDQLSVCYDILTETGEKKHDAMCIECSSGECSRCRDNKYPAKTQECRPCNSTIPDCMECSSESVCSRCSDTTVLNMNISQCLDCSTAIPDCIACSGGVCITCSDATIKNEDGSVCQECEKAIPNCESCSEGQCETCSSTFVISRNRTACEECSTAIPNCETCYEGQCEECNTAFVLASSGAACEECSIAIPNCEICFEGQCQRCSSTFVLRSDGAACEECSTAIPNCESCFEEKCDTCSSTFVLHSNRTACEECAIAIPHCEACLQGTCTTCSSTFVLSDNGIACEECSLAIPNCEVCSQGQCESCSDAFVLNSNNTACEECSTAIPNCETCFEGQCETCISTFVLTSNASACEECSTAIPNCETCSGEQCQACSHPFVLHSSGTTCEAPCTDVQAVDQCIDAVYDEFVACTTDVLVYDEIDCMNIGNICSIWNTGKQCFAQASSNCEFDEAARRSDMLHEKTSEIADDFPEIHEVLVGCVSVCDPNPCHKGGLCWPNPEEPQYVCTCPSLTAGHDCNDPVDECALSSDEGVSLCGTNGVCVDEAVGYGCMCDMYHAGLQCDVDCSDIQPGCEECRNSVCVTCAEDYVLVNNHCEDCATAVPGCLSCVGAMCLQCDDGFSLSLNARHCDDINECLESTHSCIDGDCVNEEGGYSCVCHEGKAGEYCEQDCWDLYDECMVCDKSGCLQCDDGFHIDEETHLCTANLCIPDSDTCIHGRCTGQGRHMQCVCDSGYGGATCNYTCREHIQGCTECTESACQTCQESYQLDPVTGQCKSYPWPHLGSVECGEGYIRGILIAENEEGDKGTVCDDYFRDKEATVACRNLGFTQGGTVGDVDGSYTGLDIRVDNLVCDAEASRISECRGRFWIHHDCRHIEDVLLTCYVEDESRVVMRDALSDTDVVCEQ